jgi:hypothetical protein
VHHRSAAAGTSSSALRGVILQEKGHQIFTVNLCDKYLLGMHDVKM